MPALKRALAIDAGREVLELALTINLTVERAVACAQLQLRICDTNQQLAGLGCRDHGNDRTDLVSAAAFMIAAIAALDRRRAAPVTGEEDLA